MTEKTKKGQKTNVGKIAVKALAIILGVIMVTGFVLLILKKITLTNFWILTGTMGVIAIFGVPRMRKMVE